MSYVSTRYVKMYQVVRRLVLITFIVFKIKGADNSPETAQQAVTQAA